jgi:phosphohistidine phosphatase
MKLFFLRHGEAGAAVNDDIRELTARGRADVERIAVSNASALKGIEQVLVSPIVRAQQTADIFCASAGLGVQRLSVDWLIHETPVSIALAELAKINKPTLLVGHQPLAGSLVNKLTGDNVSIGTADLVVMEGEAYFSGFMALLKHYIP